MDTQKARKNFRLFTYRHPAAWATAKRAAAVGLTVGTLAFKARKFRRLAVAALDRTQKLHATRRLAGPVRNASAAPRAIRRMRAFRKAYDVKSTRYGNAAKIIGAGGIGYAGMPAAREIGHRRYFKARMRSVKR